MPLRASNIGYNDLRHVVILGNTNFLKRSKYPRPSSETTNIVCREWYLLKNLPKISVMEGSPMSRADLRALKIKLCKTCVILSAKVAELQPPCCSRRGEQSSSLITWSSALPSLSRVAQLHSTPDQMSHSLSPCGAALPLFHGITFWFWTHSGVFCLELDSITIFSLFGKLSISQARSGLAGKL